MVSLRRAAPLALKDPITLVVALSNDRSASGTLYLDNGELFNHNKGEFLYKPFYFKKEHGQSFTMSSSEVFADALEKVGVSLEKSSAGDSYRAHVVKAKAAHQDAENSVTNAQTKIKESNSNLSKDWGPEWEYKKLDCL
ncbi:hypothetical protein PPACK8108_LOCUS22513 [Phakopsora pachyrhizi]|uniref:Uncharacterized protein n=1 Tax=Phakopsora pachyrhizi TaxID=170000 RepID=A0AAV0BMH4_PHAPC|nr:hypothetical protein PPACK8108_LOCUS22513 [Phakopsora pachyrhizi]